MFILVSTCVGYALAIVALSWAAFNGVSHDTAKAVVMSVLIVPLALASVFWLSCSKLVEKSSDDDREMLLDVYLVMAALGLIGIGSWVLTGSLWVMDRFDPPWWIAWAGLIPGLMVIGGFSFVVAIVEWGQRYRTRRDDQGHAREHLYLVILPQVGAYLSLALCPFFWQAGDVFALKLPVAVMVAFTVYAYRKGHYTLPPSTSGQGVPVAANDEVQLPRSV